MRVAIIATGKESYKMIPMSLILIAIISVVSATAKE
jgi:hypothetical protein